MFEVRSEIFMNEIKKCPINLLGAKVGGVEMTRGWPHADSG